MITVAVAVYCVAVDGVGWMGGWRGAMKSLRRSDVLVFVKMRGREGGRKYI